MARDDRSATEQHHRATMAISKPAPVLLHLNRHHHSMRLVEGNPVAVMLPPRTSPVVS
jgi:hypothetical protein